MAQHDMNIANQGFPAFRADLNSALTAIANNSSGATEPSTTFAYQWWYDTSTNVLKMRNADNDAWITIGTFNQTTDSFTPAGVTSDKIEEGNSSVEVVDSGTGYVSVVIDGVEVANIGATGTNNPFFGATAANHGGLVFSDAGSSQPTVNPCSSGSTLADNSLNLGGPTFRFKDLYLGGGVYLGGTGAANKLDDYEEGTWTVQDSSGAGLSLTINASGTYTKIGRVVAWQFYITYPVTSNTAQAKLSLPFTVRNGYPQGSVRVQSVGVNNLVAQMDDSNATLNIRNNDVAMTNADLSGKYVITSGVYFTD